MISSGVWELRSRSLPLTRPLLMGVVNVTPDSFSDGGRLAGSEEAVRYALGLVDDGADLIDVGGESTRPGSSGVSADEEAGRVLPVVEQLVRQGIVVSVDTSKPSVAAAALDLGAEVINDVTAGADPSMLGVVAAAGAGLILMHMRGEPRTMQDHPEYDSVVNDVKEYLLGRAQAARVAGVAEGRICLDPGIGFGKTLDHNLLLLRDLATLRSAGFPLVLGVSRKAFIGRLTGEAEPAARDLASAVVGALAVERGADVLRVHNVAASREALAVALAIVRGSGG